MKKLIKEFDQLVQSGFFVHLGCTFVLLITFPVVLPFMIIHWCYKKLVLWAKT